MRRPLFRHMPALVLLALILMTLAIIVLSATAQPAAMQSCAWGLLAFACQI